jgi:hypothetical protein
MILPRHDFAHTLAIQPFSAPFEPGCGKSIQIAFHEQVAKKRACFHQRHSWLIVPNRA